VYRRGAVRLRRDDALTSYDKVWLRHDEDLKHNSPLLAIERPRDAGVRRGRDTRVQRLLHNSLTASIEQPYTRGVSRVAAPDTRAKHPKGV
jgi:hypothetical protein